MLNGDFVIDPKKEQQVCPNFCVNLKESVMETLAINAPVFRKKE